MALDLDAIDQAIEGLLKKPQPPVATGAPVSLAQPAAQPMTASAANPAPKPVSFMGPRPGPEDVPQPELRMASPDPPAAVSAAANAAAPISFANPQPAAPTAPVSFRQRYEEAEARRAELQKQQPAREQFQAEKMPWWKKALVAAASVAAGINDPRVAGETARQVFGSPQRKADEKFNQANEGFKEKAAGIDSEEAGIAKEAGIALAQKALNPPAEKPEDVVKQFSDALASGDTARAEELKPRVREFLDTTQKPGAEKVDKKIDEYNNAAGRRVEVMQRPDGTTYETQRGAVRAEAGAPGATKDDPQQIADAIIRGEQPPDLKGLFRNNAPVRAALARKGYNLVKAEEDWNATQKYMATLNGSQQTRLRQAVESTKGYLDQVEEIYNQWQKVGPTSGWKTFNKGSLATAKQLPGEAGDLAHRLEARIADLTSDLGTVYKGGNSSTDESLRLAAKNLSADWNDKTFQDAIKDIRRSIVIRENSMRNLGPAGTSAGNAYTPPATQGGATIIQYDAQGNRIK